MADYLYLESLIHLPEDVQQFLRRTAILDRLSGPLCDAILEEPGAQAQLRSLEATNLFLVPLDRRRVWYRYHALFREFLLGELRRSEPHVMVKLHLRAADWYGSQRIPGVGPRTPAEHIRDGQVRPAGVEAAAVDASGRAAVDRAALARGTRPLRCEKRSPAGGVGRMGRSHGRSARRSGTVGGIPGQCVLRSGHRGWHRVIQLLKGPVSSSDLSRRPRADGTRRERRRSRRAVVEPLACLGPPLCAEAQLMLGDTDGGVARLMETAAVAATLGNVNSVILSRAELAVFAIDRGGWIGSGRTPASGARQDREPRAA